MNSAAHTLERRNLDDVRKGEYEALKIKLKDPCWRPDYGPAVFDKKAGATVIGARIFLLGFNVNLNTSDMEITSGIAKRIRETGVKKTLKDGNKIKLPGLLKSVKAIGIDLKEQGMTQIGMNLTNYKITPMHTAFETIKRLASKKGVEVIGGEIIGVILKDAILCSGKFYAPEEVHEKKLIQVAVENLGLDKLEKFISEKKIIEYMV
jgi:glutamate formiminotransferase/formiminotetrahydrofolate cyclodeaminase